MTDFLYADGGLIGTNPSPLGGTWAWILTRDGKEIRRASGIIEPSDMSKEKITNNDTELFAATRALSAMPVGWEGMLLTDSWVTICRLRNICDWKVRPNPPQEPLFAHEFKGRYFLITHLSGHPTKIELRNGKCKKGRPVSKWNAECDRVCTAMAKRFKGDR